MSMQNRRTTLGPLSMDSEANRARLSMLGGSGIAGVSSSSSSSSSRQSLMIKQPQRLSIAPGASSNAAAGNGRLSIAPGRQSMAFDPSRRQSTFGAQVGRPKDPRPIRDKSFQVIKYIFFCATLYLMLPSAPHEIAPMRAHSHLVPYPGGVPQHGFEQGSVGAQSEGFPKHFPVPLPLPRPWLCAQPHSQV